MGDIVEDNDELEEGEIKDDDDSHDSLERAQDSSGLLKPNAQNSSGDPRLNSATTAANNAGDGTKKKRKVVRKVRKKVIKRVVRKKDSSQTQKQQKDTQPIQASKQQIQSNKHNSNVNNQPKGSNKATNQNNNPNNNKGTLPARSEPLLLGNMIGSNLPIITSSTTTITNIPDSHILMTPHLVGPPVPMLPQQHPSQPQPQHILQQQPTVFPNQFDSLCEQQIYMLQELHRQQQRQQHQQHQQQPTPSINPNPNMVCDIEAELLRSASTDEDLRVPPPHMQQHALLLPQHQQSSNHLENNNISRPLNNDSMFTMHQQNQQPALPQLSNPSLLQHQTPMQGADISTMFPSHISTITTTTANINPSITGSILPQAANIEELKQETPSSPDDDFKSSSEALTKMLTMLRESTLDTSSVEYKLLPITIDDIDYSKYKLLSQYEPKLLCDPRLANREPTL